MLGTLDAHGVRVAGVTRELERLTAATAEVEMHPLVTSERAECPRLLPNPAQWSLPNSIKCQRVDLPRRLAGQHASIGGHHDIHVAPSAHAGFGILLIVVGQDIHNLHS